MCDFQSSTANIYINFQLFHLPQIRCRMVLSNIIGSSVCFVSLKTRHKGSEVGKSKVEVQKLMKTLQILLHV